MSVEHSDHELISGGQRMVQQLLFTASQLVEAVARQQEQMAQRRGQTARSGPAGAGQGLKGWEPANRPGWRARANPGQLLTAWAAALTAAADDPHAAAAMLRVEHEMRRRWPQVLDRYDGLRVEGGVHPAAAMARTLAEAAAHGWDPGVGDHSAGVTDSRPFLPSRGRSIPVVRPGPDAPQPTGPMGAPDLTPSRPATPGPRRGSSR